MNVVYRLNELRDLPKVDNMAAALGFDPPAGLTEQHPREDMRPSPRSISWPGHPSHSGTTCS